jgi:structural maintenance of chromosome 1
MSLTTYSMDAISFVLGIKSSHLRSAHLRDLVYRGRVLKTSKINDDGSADAPATNGHANGDSQDDEDTQTQRSERNDPKSAWVMAVYEDEAGEEQKWKRTITNQGASEYRINNRVVTAQQYNEALEAENILIKARNFLVFQGDVEAIASQSPKDLTRLIEQISGSLEYKAEYERLEQEAAQAAENQSYALNRRRGLNSEIKQYQEQKREADKFQAKEQERDNAIVSHILWKLFHFQRVMEESAAEIQGHQNELKEFRRGVEKYEKALESARNEATRAQREVSKVSRSIKQKEKEIEEKENSLVPIDEKVDQTVAQIDKIRKRLATITQERDQQAADIQSARKELAVVDKAQKQFEAKWKETMKKQGRELSPEDLKEYNRLKADVISRTAASQAKLEALLRQQKTDEVTVNSLKGKLDAAQAQQDKLEEEQTSLNERTAAKKAAVKDITKEIDQKKKEYNSLQSERVRTNQRHTEVEEKLQEVLKKLQEADDGRRQNEREMRIKETVTALKRYLPGVRGRVGDLCKPKQKKYDEAVITALGRDFDSVVVDTEKTGTECVKYLKEQRLPPMTFIPLDNIKVNPPNSSLKGLAKARLTIDTIDFEPSLERAMSYACGTSLVCDDLATAKYICYERIIQVKAVTLEGFVIHKAGLMTGGRGAEGKGGKRRFEEVDVQNLIKMKDRLMAELESLPRGSRRGAAEEQLQSDLTSLEQQLAYARSELVAFDQNLASTKKRLDHEKRQVKDIKPKYNEQAKELEATQGNVKRQQDEVAQVEDEVFAAFCRRLGYSDIRAYEAQQGSLEQEASQQRSDFLIQKQRLESRLSWENSRLQETEGRLKRMQDQVATLEKDIATYQAEKESLEESFDVYNAELTTLAEQLEALKSELSSKNEKVNDAKNQLQKRSHKVEGTLKEIASKEAEAQRAAASRFTVLRRCKLENIKIPLEEGSATLDSLPVDNVLQVDPDAMDVDDSDPGNAEITDYGIEVDFDELDDDYKEEPGDKADEIEEKLQEKISSLVAELEKLNPNSHAVERLQTVEARLRTTEEEFEEARRVAKQTRDDFQAVKEKRFNLFNKAFTHISEQINTVYKDLTRSAAHPLGGSAFLDTEDSDTPYLSGIRYHAMPPLKRFRDMEHLSGGEKTMAALALLFSVHSYQPSPFFVLDEVDAALDNANVEKISNYIRGHAGPGMQFIVISLKTGLFQGSESLVGVYRDQDANSSNTLTLDVSCLSLFTFDVMLT